MSLDLWLLRGAVDENAHIIIFCCPVLGKVSIRSLLMNLDRRRCMKEEIE